MNFLWDIVLSAHRQGWKEEELFFQQAAEYSPFYEQAFSCINETKVDSGRIELNLFYRLADFFRELLAAEDMGLKEGEYSEFRQYFIDAMLHAILYTDLRNGLTGREIYIRKLREELLDGTYWQGAAEAFSLLESEQQSRLASCLLTQMETGSSLIIFRRALLVVCPEVSLYQLKEERKELLLYLVEKETKAAKKKLELVQAVFLPIGFRLRTFWEFHFGIIGVEETMRLEEIALY
ncbi:MAG: hypothetical protein ACI4D2_06645 [Lachnospiraceae bacterium]